MRAADRGVKWQAIVCFLVVICGWNLAGEAQAYRRHRSSYSHNYYAARQRQQQVMIQAATAQKNAAQQVLNAAEAKGGAAQSKLDAALSKLRDEAQKFHDAQSTTRHLAKELNEIENEIVSEQKDDSPYAKASKQTEAARKKLKETEEAILSEPDVQKELTGSVGSRLFEKKASILELHSEYMLAKAALESEASQLSKIRSELFQSDKDWKEAAEALTQARKDEKAAEEKTHGGTSGRIANLEKVKSASEAAAAARAAIAQADAVIRANGGNRNSQSSSASRNPPPNRKK